MPSNKKKRSESDQPGKDESQSGISFNENKDETSKCLQSFSCRSLREHERKIVQHDAYTGPFKLFFQVDQTQTA